MGPCDCPQRWLIEGLDAMLLIVELVVTLVASNQEICLQTQERLSSGKNKQIEKEKKKANFWEVKNSGVSITLKQLERTLLNRR